MKQLRQRAGYAAFFIIGCGLFYLALRKQNFTEIFRQLQQADYSWAWLVLVVTIFNHIIRAKRWQLLLQPTGHSVSFTHAFWAMLFGYFVSLGVPRLGELSRCLVLNRKENTPVETALGTVITERVIDILCLLILVVAVAFLQRDLFEAIFRKEIFPPLQSLWANQRNTIGGFLMFLGILFLIAVFLRRKLEKVAGFQWIRRFLQKLWQGASSVFHVRQQGLFWLYTALIWLGYFYMTYGWFFSLKTTNSLDATAGFAMLVVGSLGKSVPIQGGGFGAYHFLITQTLVYFGVASMHGFVLATIIHGFQTIFYLVAGVVAWIAMGKRPHPNPSPSGRSF